MRFIHWLFPLILGVKVLYIYKFIYINIIYIINNNNVTGFEKTRLPHTSSFPTLIQCNFVCKYANNLQLLHKGDVAYRNDMLKFQSCSLLLQ